MVHAPDPFLGSPRGITDLDILCNVYVTCWVFGSRHGARGEMVIVKKTP